MRSYTHLSWDNTHWNQNKTICLFNRFPFSICCYKERRKRSIKLFVEYVSAMKSGQVKRLKRNFSTIKKKNQHKFQVNNPQKKVEPNDIAAAFSFYYCNYWILLIIYIFHKINAQNAVIIFSLQWCVHLVPYWFRFECVLALFNGNSPVDFEYYVSLLFKFCFICSVCCILALVVETVRKYNFLLNIEYMHWVSSRTHSASQSIYLENIYM